MTPCRTKCAQVAAERASHPAGAADDQTSQLRRRGASPVSGCTWNIPDISRHWSEPRFETAPRIGIAAAVSDMPERYRSPFVLRYVNGLQPEEVAAALGRSVETTRAELNHAVNALREALSSAWRARARTR